MTPKALHQIGMRYSCDADMAGGRGDWESRRVALLRALSLEVCAATLLVDHPDCEPTRSMLFGSAATLAMRVGEFGCASELAALGLGGNPPACEREYLLQVVADAEAKVLVGYGYATRSSPDA